MQLHHPAADFRRATCADNVRAGDERVGRLVRDRAVRSHGKCTTRRGHSTLNPREAHRGRRVGEVYEAEAPTTCWLRGAGRDVERGREQRYRKKCEQAQDRARRRQPEQAKHHLFRETAVR